MLEKSGQATDGALVQPRPFLKWAGGKRQLVPALRANMPKQYGRYLEPMIGGGAFFFELQPKNAYIADINEELVNLYLVVRDETEALIRDLRKHEHNADYFYKLRDADRSGTYKRWGPVKRASRLIYLNKTCFNGLYRVNAQGHFNVPFGDYKNPRIVDEDNLRACSLALRDTKIVLGSFEHIRKVAKKGDFVYFDPPYVPLSTSANFTSYSKERFDADMQIKLRDLCIELDRKAVKFMLSNSSAPFVLELYKDFHVQLLDASRAINSKAEGRGKVKEVLVRNY
ncbi:MAG: DNA adenine methylase [Bdellovibrionales bacterium]|nr:DNA adenine methylase [Bdellovibrionales bacterium]